jgi:hypothetical protein
MREIISKFEDKEIIELKILYENNIPMTDISLYFNVHFTTIWRIVKKCKLKRLTIKQVLKV